MNQNANTYRYLLSGISVSPDAPDEECLNQAANRMKRMGVSCRSLHFRLYKRSVDARKKNDIRLVCTVLVETDRPISASVCQKNQLRELSLAEPELRQGSESLASRPLVVGMGPAGLFAALLLAQKGYAPILIDRGGNIEERVTAVKRFYERAELNPDCNIQFGAGGAGTFSDGKLVTRIHDPYCQFVLNSFVRFGAPKEILTLAKPHIGTDVLRNVVQNILCEIERLDGKLLYHCRMDAVCETSDGGLRVKTSCGELSCGAVILAVGHSARDTYAELIRQNYAIEPKPLSVGFRIEHLQADIDAALYGSFAGHPKLGHAEYALSDTRTSRGVYTFCMCPGGEVVAAASEEGGLVVNGMSNHARSGRNANSAVLASVGIDDYEPINGNPALGAIAYQRAIEKAAFAAGGGNYDAPVMTVGDLLSGTRGTEPSRILPTYRGGRIKTADFQTVYPQSVLSSLRYALSSFGKKLQGFDTPDAVLTAAETRTSAPLRILRHPDLYTAIGHELIYPCGEGAGYAGGITSAAVDGLRVAEALVRRFAPNTGELGGIL